MTYNYNRLWKLLVDKGMAKTQMRLQAEISTNILADLITERKWTRFPEKEIRYKESTEITLGDFFEIKRGLATGDNSFFIMSRKKNNRIRA